MTSQPLDFTGKIVSLSTQADTLAVKNCQFQTIQSRLFVVGEVPRGTSNNDWAMGQRCAVAWDQVTDFVVFESEDSYVEQLSKSGA